MKTDVSHFPFVWLWFNTSNPESVAFSFVEFEQLLARKKPFVLLNDEGFDIDGSHEHSHEERKQTTLWMKRHKEALRTYVKGSIYIEPNAIKRLAAQPFATESVKFWGYPMHLVASEDEALNLACTLLGSELNTTLEKT
ncbi:hypothetical protein [Gluconobacter japonicus]|uniref:hypothetical protein n=1 Tax=Gluconobacter japonicus TaxID=376620 RepID=UPI0039ED0379